MRKVLFEVPAVGLRVPSFGVALLLACLAALALTAWRAKREKLDPETVYELAIWLMSGGFVGARLLYLVAHPESLRGVADILRIWQGGIVFYGCILGGLIGSVIYWVRNPFPFLPMADAVAPGVVVGGAVGRVGCWLNGCCYGAVTDRPWAATFPAGTLVWARHVGDGLIPLSATRSLPVHPTQLLGLADGLVLLTVLTAFFPRRRRDGEVMALLMVTYPVTRFLNEALRGDEPALLGGLTLSQWISVVIFAGGLTFWVYLSRLPRVRYIDSAGNAVPAPALSRRAPDGASART